MPDAWNDRHNLGIPIRYLRRFGQALAILPRLLVSLMMWKVLLTLVSGYTTVRGLMLLYDTFGSDHGSGSMGWLSFIIPLSVGGATHAIIFWSLGRWVSLRKCVYLLALAAPLQVIAVATSYGTHWTHMRGASVTIDSFVGVHSAIIRGIHGFVHSYRSMAGAMKSLADHSEAQAKIEEQSGTSCGSHAGAGRGSRYELRMSDRATFASFNTNVSSRQKALEELVGRAEKITAITADDVMGQLGNLRRIVDEAKGFETDALLRQLTATAQQRVQMGKAPISVATGKRTKALAPTFTCPDPTLERLLKVVISTVGDLKSIPEVDIPDARNAQVGFTMALRRLASALFGTRVTAASRTELKEARRQDLHAPAAKAAEGFRADDLGPLVVATVIEMLLTLLFRLGRGSLAEHPGLDELRELDKNQARRRTFEVVWRALGGADPESLRRLFASHTKFERGNTLVFVPLYSGHGELESLHHLMLVLTHVNLAKLSYTGTILASMFALGLPGQRSASLRAHGAIRVFKMSPVDYLAFMLDGATPPPPGARSATRNDNPANDDQPEGEPDQSAA